MLAIATIAIRFDVEADVATRNQIAGVAFDLAEQAGREYLPVQEFGVEAVVERGSIDVFVTILLAAPTLLGMLATYGSAADGLDRLKADLRSMKRYFVKELPHRAALPAEAFSDSRLTLEELSRIGRFISEAQVGTLSPLEAAERACAELEHLDGPLDPTSRRQLQKSFSAIAPKGQDREPQVERPHDSRPASRRPPTHRRRVPRRPSGRDRIRIWRNPGESDTHRDAS